MSLVYLDSTLPSLNEWDDDNDPLAMTDQESRYVEGGWSLLRWHCFRPMTKINKYIRYREILPKRYSSPEREYVSGYLWCKSCNKVYKLKWLTD